MEKHPYYYTPTPPPPSPQQEQIQQQPPPPPNSSQTPHQHNLPHHYHHVHSQQQFQNPIQPQLQLNHNPTSFSNPSSTSTYERLNTTRSSHHQPLNLTGNPNENPPILTDPFQLPPQYAMPPAQPTESQSESSYCVLYKKLRFKYADLMQYNDHINEKLKDKQEETQTLRKTFEDKETEYKSQLALYQQQLRDKDEEIANLRREVNTSTNEYNDLVKQNHEIRMSYDQELMRQSKEFKEVQLDRDKFKNVNQMLTKEVGSLSKQLETEKADHSKLHEEVKNFQMKAVEEKNKLEGNGESYRVRVPKLEEELNDC